MTRLFRTHIVPHNQGSHPHKVTHNQLRRSPAQQTHIMYILVGTLARHVDHAYKHLSPTVAHLRCSQMTTHVQKQHKTRRIFQCGHSISIKAAIGPTDPYRIILVAELARQVGLIIHQQTFTTTLV